MDIMNENTNEDVSKGSDGIENIVFTKELNTNVNAIKQIFSDNDTLITRYFENQYDNSIKCCIIYLDGMINNKLIDDNIIEPILKYKLKKKSNDFIDVISNQIMTSDSIEKTAEFEKIVQAIVYGDTVLLSDGSDQVLILNTKGWSTRAIAEPEAEKVLKGPREGFNESLMINLSLLRRKLRTQDLKMKFQTYGAKSNTKACICYIDSLVDKDILSELNNRLQKFSIDGVLDVNYLIEYIRDAPYSPFKTIGNTERPDVVAAKLLEGKIAVFLDGTPVVMTLPYLFIENFQSNEDYYLNFFFATFNRLVRILCFFIALSAPAIYVAITTFHQEMIPTSLLLSISLARQDAPLPTCVEAIVMVFAFDILREAGSRMPFNIGQAFSILGALVIGQAAVDARLISSPMIVIVALTGITGLMLYKVKGAIIVLQMLLLLLSSFIGLYGYMFGMMGLLIHLLNLRSFGVPVITNIFTKNVQDNKDILVRAPWPFMINRPKFMATDKVRSNKNTNGDIKQ
jgi:spore germination protein KA